MQKNLQKKQKQGDALKENYSNSNIDDVGVDNTIKLANAMNMQ